MDLKLTGKFIQERRKAKNWTQVQLAEKLSVSEKTISKWECGNGFPDTTLILPLCKALEITANELLSAKTLDEKEYKQQAEENLILLKSAEEKNAKFLLTVMWTLGVICTIFFAGVLLLAGLVEALPDWLRIVIICGSLILLVITCLVLLRIEQKAGYYMCKKCEHKFIPSYSEVLFAVHTATSRYLKCPNCKKRHWCKKVVK